MTTSAFDMTSREPYRPAPVQEVMSKFGSVLLPAAGVKDGQPHEPVPHRFSVYSKPHLNPNLKSER